jgi:hypothetical protein
VQRRGGLTARNLDSNDGKSSERCSKGARAIFRVGTDCDIDFV